MALVSQLQRHTCSQKLRQQFIWRSLASDCAFTHPAQPRLFTCLHQMAPWSGATAVE